MENTPNLPQAEYYFTHNGFQFKVETKMALLFIVVQERNLLNKKLENASQVSFNFTVRDYIKQNLDQFKQIFNEYKSKHNKNEDAPSQTKEELDKIKNLLETLSQ